MGSSPNEPLRPYLVAIAGCSCCGKTTLARRLAAELGGVVLPLDAYYHDLSHLELAARVRANFDSPEAIETGLLFAHLRRLARGEPVLRPVYDFFTHTRSARQERVPAAPFVILDGLFALYWNEVRRLCGTKVFVELDDETCLARRLERDVRERGRTPESVRKQYAETVRPMAQRFIIPTRRFADIVVSGAAPVTEAADRIKAHLAAAQPDRPVYTGGMAKRSAGLLMYRRRERLEVFLVHPGGPYWSKKDAGVWSIPKGEYEEDENPLAAAKREFHEETGLTAGRELLALGEAPLPSGKLVTAWAFEGDADPATIRSNTFTMEWPPRSGRKQEFPEVDRAAWFTIEEAREKIAKGQRVFLDRLESGLADRARS